MQLAEGSSEHERAEWTRPSLVARWRRGEVTNLHRYLLFGQRTLRRWTGKVHTRVFRTSIPDRLAPLVGREVMSVLGDSHVRVFSEMSRQGSPPDTWIDVTVARGASALGLGNIDSTTNASRVFQAALAPPVPVTRRTLVWLGEVDCGWLIWRLSATRGTSISLELRRSLVSYQTFLEGLISAGRSVTIASVVPPTIADYTQWTGLAGARSQVTATLQERTNLTLTYNLNMKEWAQREGCGYLDLDPWLLDQSTGLLAERYRNHLEWDHHLDNAALSAVLSDRISALEWPTISQS